METIALHRDVINDRQARVQPGVLRFSYWDVVLVLLALCHGLLLRAMPVLPVIALGVWWNSNTIAHNFVHRPFFTSRGLNRLFSLYLTAILGIPQSIWRARHLAHHADQQWKPRLDGWIAVELFMVLAIWAGLVALDFKFFCTVYLPGTLLGLGICYVHGYYEHAGGTTSHYGAPYNWLLFNDGYHVEHHLRPGAHWTQLPRRQASGARQSRWPAPIRWLDLCSLDALECLVIKSRRLQNFVLRSHERAWRRILPDEPIERIAVVGGGLFPRTALILQRLLPHASITIIDASSRSLAIAEPLLPETVRRIHAFYDPAVHQEFDLVVLPLALIGDRQQFYTRASAPIMVIHDWIWRRRGQSCVVSWLLLKRLNMIRTIGKLDNLAEQSRRLCRY